MSDLHWCNLLESLVQRYAGDNLALAQYLRDRLENWPDRTFWYRPWLDGEEARVKEEVSRHLQTWAETWRRENDDGDIPDTETLDRGGDQEAGSPPGVGQEGGGDDSGRDDQQGLHRE